MGDKAWARIFIRRSAKAYMGHCWEEGLDEAAQRRDSRKADNILGALSLSDLSQISIPG